MRTNQQLETKVICELLIYPPIIPPPYTSSSRQVTNPDQSNLTNLIDLPLFARRTPPPSCTRQQTSYEHQYYSTSNNANEMYAPNALRFRTVALAGVSSRRSADRVRLVFLPFTSISRGYIALDRLSDSAADSTTATAS
ncbi:MAG TPA: hypothetical protein VGO47_00505 [Chlamydiales bacterium]|nr:hypothetical protein [Chlamydiales bacterium]